LRNGWRILLTEHPEDVVTLFGIFVRREYGLVSPGDIVVDVGANFGAFSLFSVFCGASKVFCYEPCSATFEVIQHNVRMNRLEDKIIPVRRAVTGVSDCLVRLTVSDGPRNRIVLSDAEAKTELVSTVSLQGIIETHRIERLDVLKLDCEGAEYDILFSTPPDVLKIVRSIRMEYHRGVTNEFLRFLQSNRFKLCRLKRYDRMTGILFLCARDF
jgi:FkbM family methyltransferase